MNPQMGAWEESLNRKLENMVAAMALEYERTMREVVSVRAPLRISKGGRGRRIRAATSADTGAPPRRVSGQLYGSIQRRQINRFCWAVGTWTLPYPARLQFRQGHPFLEATIERGHAAAQRIAGQNIRVS